MPTILLVDDNCASLNLLHRLLAGAGYHVHTDSDGDMALAAYQAQCPDMVVLAWQAPDPNGLAVVRNVGEVLAIVKPFFPNGLNLPAF